jgi:hypothetical protein
MVLNTMLSVKVDVYILMYCNLLRLIFTLLLYDDLNQIPYIFIIVNDLFKRQMNILQLEVIQFELYQHEWK